MNKFILVNLKIRMCISISERQIFLGRGTRVSPTINNKHEAETESSQRKMDKKRMGRKEGRERERCAHTYKRGLTKQQDTQCIENQRSKERSHTNLVVLMNCLLCRLHQKHGHVRLQFSRSCLQQKNREKDRSLERLGPIRLVISEAFPGCPEIKHSKQQQKAHGNIQEGKYAVY